MYNACIITSKELEEDAMPALQVRDFPAPLYEELRSFADANHRSMAQQVIVAVEDMLVRGSAGPASPSDLFDSSVAPLSRTLDTEAVRQARIERRRELFARIHEQAANLPEELPDPVGLVCESRRAREEHLMDVLGDAGETSA